MMTAAMGEGEAADPYNEDARLKEMRARGKVRHQWTKYRYLGKGAEGERQLDGNGRRQVEEMMDWAQSEKEDLWG